MESPSEKPSSSREPITPAKRSAHCLDEAVASLSRAQAQQVLVAALSEEPLSHKEPTAVQSQATFAKDMMPMRSYDSILGSNVDDAKRLKLCGTETSENQWPDQAVLALVGFAIATRKEDFSVPRTRLDGTQKEQLDKHTWFV